MKYHFVIRLDHNFCFLAKQTALLTASLMFQGTNGDLQSTAGEVPSPTAREEVNPAKNPCGPRSSSFLVGLSDENRVLAEYLLAAMCETLKLRTQLG